MAKRVRDYKAEERRRNELAKQRGYSSRAAERSAKRRAVLRDAGFSGPAELRDERLQARSWSEIHSHKEQSAYRDDFTPKQLRQYLDAFVYDTPGPYAKITRKDHIRDFLTENYPNDYPEKDADLFWLNY